MKNGIPNQYNSNNNQNFIKIIDCTEPDNKNMNDLSVEILTGEQEIINQKKKLNDSNVNKILIGTPNHIASDLSLLNPTLQIIGKKDHNSFTTYAKKFMHHITPNQEKSSKKASNNNITYVVNSSNINSQKQDTYNINNNFLFINKFPAENNSNNSVVNNHFPNVIVNNVFSANNEVENIISNNDKVESSEKRIDRRGVVIEKGGKKHRITFLDRIDDNKRLIDTVKIESYKAYNIGNTYSESSGKPVNNSVSCCIIY